MISKLCNLHTTNDHFYFLIQFSSTNKLISLRITYLTTCLFMVHKQISRTLTSNIITSNIVIISVITINIINRYNIVNRFIVADTSLGCFGIIGISRDIGGALVTFRNAPRDRFDLERTLYCGFRFYGCGIRL